MTSVIVYEVVAVTHNLGTVAIGHRWALRQLETGGGFFVRRGGQPLTWPTLAAVDAWLQKGKLADSTVVIWPPQVLLGEKS